MAHTCCPSKHFLYCGVMFAVIAAALTVAPTATATAAPTTTTTTTAPMTTPSVAAPSTSTTSAPTAAEPSPDGPTPTTTVTPTSTPPSDTASSTSATPTGEAPTSTSPTSTSPTKKKPTFDLKSLLQALFGTKQLPVKYNFFAGARAELLRPGGSLPGSNNFSCRPSAAHPRPVILIHGTGGGQQTNWATLVPTLANAGYCVFAPTYGAISTKWPMSAIGGLGDKVDSAWQIKEFIDKVMASTGASQVDIVGHSLGTEIPTYWMKYLGGKGKVAHYVSLAPFWRGSSGADSAAITTYKTALGVEESASTCLECVSPPATLTFSAAVRYPTPYLPGVAYTNIVTEHDEMVKPYTLGLLDGPGVTNVVVQQGCDIDRADHMAITSDRRVAAMVLGALDPASAPPVPCVAVKPYIGG